MSVLPNDQLWEIINNIKHPNWRNIDRKLTASSLDEFFMVNKMK